MSIMHNPLHPGEVVKDALLDGTDLTVGDAAKRLKVDRTTLSRLLNGRSGMSADMACRLSLLLGTSAEVWLNLQRDYDLWQVKKKVKFLNIRPIKSRKTAS